MFTGLVQSLGTVKTIRQRDGGVTLAIDAPTLPVKNDTLVLGESIAVNGACLTVARILTPTSFEADVLEETLRCTMFGRLSEGDTVNLERALRLGDRLGGHLVTGHIDGIGYLSAQRTEGRDRVYRFTCTAEFARCTMRKGSVTINGTSLTVCTVGDDYFEVALIPTTLRETNLGMLTLGDAVNLESDILGAYVRRALGCDTTLSIRQIIAAGFAD